MTAALGPPGRHAGGMRRVLRAASTLLIVAGVLVLGDVGLTVVWQEPVTAIYTAIVQDQLADELIAIQRPDLSTAQRGALGTLPADGPRMAFLARTLQRSSRNGDPLARITIKRIDLDYVVVQGTDSGSLRKGPGHYTQTPLPGLSGTVAIAGHRTTYGAPFAKIDELRPGDQITLAMPYGKFTYTVWKTKIVSPSALWVISSQAVNLLVLTACHPRYSAAQRIVVFARLAQSTPLGEAVAAETT